MLEQTFVHIPGIGKQTELDLWKRGIHTWDDTERFEKCFGAVQPRLQNRLDRYIPLSRQAIRRKDASFFARLSAIGEAWRLFPEFADCAVYLDIETTGLSTVFDTITMVGLYDGRKYEAFVQGHNLQDLPKRLIKYSVLVTFNGTGFDLRFLKLAFPDLRLPPVHIDLRWVTRKFGMSGGLKSIESSLGLSRPDSVENLSGYDATVLWAKYIRGERAALDQLIEYNMEDVVNLKAIMEIAYDRLSKKWSTYLKENIISVFSGAAQHPRSNKRSLVKRATIHPASSGLVEKLLSNCSDSRRQRRIVGIDLTGSERRATGWALMDGAQVTTKTLRTIDELVEETVAAKPDLVSIDSPLSLPEGHGDTDVPIYRKCELALKRMGISVFWCLLPSMEMLTRRGIALAQRLREAGCKVIESYPGAAQDILGIPRKKASLEELKWGLSRAGIAGDFVTSSITHDEVDAITSALVGLFYLAGDYIALGTKSEDFLIVPRSEKFNYAKLAEIVAATGLEEVPRESGTEVKSLAHAH